MQHVKLYNKKYKVKSFKNFLNNFPYLLKKEICYVILFGISKLSVKLKVKMMYSMYYLIIYSKIYYNIIKLRNLSKTLRS
jgi:hypothetical protein